MNKFPHTLGIEAINFWIKKLPQTLTLRFVREFAIESIKTLLKINNCTFNIEFYKQINGTAMGTKFAATYPNLTMGYFQVQVHDIFEVKWESKFKEFLIEKILRQLWNYFKEKTTTRTY